ncbi:MAG: MFS transporter, partial [Ignavibacteriaceae bacterium]|nr:MFS transporter [Ignavibacteriaceae bacterium]
VMGVASLTPAFPQIAIALNLTMEQAGLLITFFTLPGVFLTPVLGVAADRFGRKKVLVPSLFLFAIAGTACFFARDFYILLLFRLLQGIGGASLGSLNVTLIGDLFSGKDRASAMGFNASILSIGTASYPAIGGALAMLSWHAPFLLPIAALPVGLVVLYKLDITQPKNQQNLINYLKATIVGVKRKEIAGIFLTSVVTFIILYGSYLTFFPFLLAHSFNANTLVIGLMMSSMSIVTAITSSQLGKLAAKFSAVTLLKIAFALYTLSLILIPFMNVIWFLFLPITIFGIAHGINIPGLQTLLADYSPAEQRAAFMSLNGMVLRLGQTLGPVVMGALFVTFGINGVFLSGALIALLMLGGISLLISEVKNNPSQF